MPKMRVFNIKTFEEKKLNNGMFNILFMTRLLLETIVYYNITTQNRLNGSGVKNQRDQTNVKIVGVTLDGQAFSKPWALFKIMFPLN